MAEFDIVRAKKIDAPAAADRVVITRDSQTSAGGEMARVPVSAFVLAGGAAQVAGAAYTDAAVAVETSRATTAEALKANLAGATFTGAVAVPVATLPGQAVRLAQVKPRLVSSFAGADQQACLVAALASGETHLILDAGSNGMDAIHTVAMPGGLVLEGQGGRGACTLTTSAAAHFRLSGVNVHIKGINFVSTKVDVKANVYYGGLIHVYDDGSDNGYDANMDGLVIEQCRFSCPTINSGGFGLYADRVGNTSIIKKVWLLDNFFDGTGSAAVVCQNQNVNDTTFRIHDVWMHRNLWKDMGQIDDYGMAVTLTGWMRSILVTENIIDNALDIGLEMAAGVSSSVFARNGFRNLTRRSTPNNVTNPISCSTNNSPVREGYGNQIIGNFQCDDDDTTYITGGLFFGNLRGGRVEGNSFRLTDGLSIRDCQDTTLKNNYIKSKSLTPLYFQATASGTCANIETDGNVIDASDKSSAVTAMATFDGAGCTNIALKRGRLVRPSGGGQYSQLLNSSTGCFFRQVGIGNTEWYPELHIISMSDADLVLKLNDAQYDDYRVTGTLTTNRVVSFPANCPHTINLYNNTTGNFSLSIAPTGGTGVTVTNGANKRMSIRLTDVSTAPVPT